MLANLHALGSITELSSGDRWSGARLLHEVAVRVERLQARGVGPRSRVLIAHGGTAAFFADLLAVWQLGACAACVDGQLSASEMANVTDFFGPELVLVDEHFAHRLDAAVMCSQREADGKPAAVAPRGQLDDPALVLFTSGTTGEPKGVVHSFRSLAARVALNRAALGDAVLARSLCMLPTHFGHGLIGNALTPLLAGHELILAPFGRELAGDLGTHIDTHNVTFFSSVPTHWRMILESGAPMPRLAPLAVHVGSAPLSADLWRTIMAWCATDRVVNMYGITETANWIGGASARDVAPEDGLIGQAWGGSLAVRADDGSLSAVGEGELVVNSPTLMTGYLDRPELTDAVLHGGWFRTGDLGRIDRRGLATITGRLKHEINRGGVKIQPEDVDLVLERHPAVAECCTFGIPDELRGELVGCAVRARGGHVDVAELAAFCGASVRPHAVPEQWFVVDEIPKTDRGKINRERVREHCLAAPGAGSARP